MSALSGHVEDYLRLRRALGFKLERAGQLAPAARRLPRGRRRGTITSELAIAWARLPERAQPNHWAQRLAIARGFARYLQTIDPATESRRLVCSRPAVTARPPTCGRSGHLSPAAEHPALRPPLRAATHEALFGLLATSGMRVGEAIGLERDDVDLEAGVITIREAKFDRARLVPLHPTATEALRATPPSVTACARGPARGRSSSPASAPARSQRRGQDAQGDHHRARRPHRDRPPAGT